jgi:PAS domain S-box-containing protein
MTFEEKNSQSPAEFEQADTLQKIRKQVYIFCALAAIILPAFIGLWQHLLGPDRPVSDYFVTFFTIISSSLNLAVYIRRQNLHLACAVHVALSNICYGIAIFSTGEVDANITIFAPLVVVISGLLGGAYLGVGSAAFLSISLMALEVFESMSTVSTPVTQSSETVNVEIVACLTTIAGIIWLYERIRARNETILRTMNKALLKEKAHNDQIMYALDASAIVAITDVKGKIIRVNENFCRISGYSQAELLGEDHRLLNSGRHSKEFFVDIWRTISSGKVWTGEIENRSKDGNTYFVQTVITPLHNEHGKIERYMAVRFDVTKVREVSRQLDEAQRVAKIGSWSYHVGGQCTLWSKQMYELHDMDSNLPTPDFEQLLKIIHPDDRKQWQSGVDKCFRSGNKYKSRFRIQTLTGRHAWLETVSEAVRNRDGEVIKIRGTCQDVTEIVAAEELIKKEQIELATRQRFLDSILSNIPLMILVKDYRNDLRCSLVNRTGEKLLGIQSDLMLGKSNVDLYPKEHANYLVKKERELFIKGDIVHIPAEIIDTPHGQKVLSTTKVPTFDQSGNPELLISISNDITEEMHMKEQLEIERAKVIQASKMASLGEMSAGIAHEINNPLMIIAGTARALPKFTHNHEELQNRIQTINKSIKRIQKIVSGLRKFSRTSGSTEMKTHSISDIIKEVLVITGVKSRRFDVSIELSIDSEPLILCNEIEIEQVLVNLINNSIDAVKDRDEKWIKINVHEIEEKIILKVADSGPGIPLPYREKLFQPFFTTKPVGEGTGLGLAIVKGILDEHKATIEISADSPTTCFVIIFQKVLESNLVD